MKARMIPATIALGAILLSLLPAPRSQAVIPVIDATNLAQQIAHYTARATEIFQKYEQIRHQIEQLDYELQNVDQVPGIWRELEVFMAELSHVIQQGDSIVYSRDNLEAMWNETFPGLQRIDRAVYPEGWYEVYAQAATRTLDTQWGVMRNVRHQSTRFHTSQRLLGQIKDLSDRAEGNVEVQQVSNMLLAYLAEEQTKTLQMVSAATNALVVERAYRLSREMQSVEETHVWLSEARRPVQPLSGTTRFLS